MSLWVPPHVGRDVVQQDAADIRLAAALQGQLDWWNRELKLIDDRLEMVWFDESASHIVGVIPNRYHCIRWGAGDAPANIIPIEGPNGEFVEPNSAVFDKLRAGDMWNAEARRDRQKRQERLLERKRKQQERETEDRQAEIRERYLSATRTQVSTSTDSPWTQNAAGRRGRKAA